MMKRNAAFTLRAEFGDSIDSYESHAAQCRRCGEEVCESAVQVSRGVSLIYTGYVPEETLFSRNLGSILQPVPSRQICG